MKLIKASIDRFEEDFAVVYSDEEDGKKFDIPRKLVSPDIKEGSRVRLFCGEEDNQVVRVELDKQRTEEARRRIRSKFQRLLKGEHLRT